MVGGALLAEDDLVAGEPRGASVVEARAGNRDAGPALVGLGIAIKDRAALLKIARQDDVHQAGLAVRIHPGHAGNGLRKLTAARDQAHAAWTFGD